MPSQILPTGFVHVQVLMQTSTGHQAMNNWAYDTDDVVGQTEVTALSTNIAPFVKAFLTNPGRYVGVRVYVGNDGPDLVFESTAGAGTGLLGGALCPPQVQGLIQKTTGFAGRAFRGRVFTPDVPEGAVDDSGNLSGAYLTAISNYGDHMQNDPPATGHFGIGVLLHSAISTPTPLADCQASTKVATLRNRFDR